MGEICVFICQLLSSSKKFPVVVAKDDPTAPCVCFNFTAAVPLHTVFLCFSSVGFTSFAFGVGKRQIVLHLMYLLLAPSGNFKASLGQILGIVPSFSSTDVYHTVSM